MKKLVLSLVLISLFSCSDDDDQSNSSTSGCSSGQVCDAAAASDEVAIDMPAYTVGVYETVYDYASDDSPFAIGTTATFEITEDESLIVSIDGFDCVEVKNPYAKDYFEPDSNNFFYKDECLHDLAFNVSFDTSDNFNEVNVQPLVGEGFYGQFKLQ
ncbi:MULTISPECIES: hypothetical protein [Mesonia]|uniref:Uncharacterized protein n=1 Tax=Mesonia oceanica TaxID=2687242 RepID=A0AC61Y5R8_9FLAO|nr:MULTISPECIES: hypothetical protein [Mesonia]MAN28902.1 hypothetical protein [Mesonia sp.]MAQ42683.1 hypothetical protein [Mesonia sp.]MBJ99221.1 hypothetical protein [Flavobacteriaceae bacterium]VVU99780.1 hypothetical protein FVB9532_01039 [Mesonia oceanica]|tara:strand:+ start:366 stop:836 length:471 start_codon:yes stop_codon:yes gene_type:complete